MPESCKLHYSIELFLPVDLLWSVQSLIQRSSTLGCTIGILYCDLYQQYIMYKQPHYNVVYRIYCLCGRFCKKKSSPIQTAFLIMICESLRKLQKFLFFHRCQVFIIPCYLTQHRMSFYYLFFFHSTNSKLSRQTLLLQI